MQALKWWQSAVFYEVWPRSFADGNGDGIGDFIGLIDRLDYLKDLGVDALWIGPHFPSPLFDVGYDVADYTGVAPEYGTLDDFQRCLDGAHQRGLRVILDLVPNHTSHQHAWFVESRASRDNPKRDWYVWHPGKNGGPPNNWCALFGGSAWEYDPATEQYYYHFFLKQQPDLNWRNPAVKQAMWAAVRFWLELGVDGYRLDAIATIFENPALPDHRAAMTQAELRRALRGSVPERPDAYLSEQWRLMYQEQIDQPGVHALMQELRAVVDEYPDRVLVGENEDVRYYGDGGNELHLAFNFPLMQTDRLMPAWIRANQAERLAALPPGAWPCNTLNNHDNSRLYNRYSDGRHAADLARLALALMLTLPGTPFLYYGEEIGMTDYRLTELSSLTDTSALEYYVALITGGTPTADALLLAADFSRDRCRTPMQWTNAPQAGFCPADVTPWLPVNPNYAPPPVGRGVNVAGQASDPNSLLNFYRQLLRLRRQTPALIAGGYQPLDEAAEDYLAFLRTSSERGQTALIVLNFTEHAHSLNFEAAGRAADCLYSTASSQGAIQALSALPIVPFEIYIGLLAEDR